MAAFSALAALSYKSAQHLADPIERFFVQSSKPLYNNGLG